jgi:hypothetical protein
MAQRPSILEFDPSWIKDPVPWPWLFQQLDTPVLVQLTTVHLEMQNAVLEAQLTANRSALNIIKNAGKAGQAKS